MSQTSPVTPVPGATATPQPVILDPDLVDRARRRARAGIAALLLTAVAATVLGTAFSGAALPTNLLDPGALVRWGQPVVGVVSELAAALAVGGLFLGAVVLPHGGGRTASDARAWPATMLVASVGAGVWAIASLIHLVLSYASIAGRPLSEPSFGSELGMFVTSVALGRTLLGIVGVAALTCVAALLVTRPRGALLTALLAAVALALQAETGHTAGSTNHELAVSSLFLHLGGAALWIGGLAALALVAHLLGRDLGPAVGRYSTVAAWCYVAVAISGAVNAAIRLGGPGGLDGLVTDYGRLLLTKVVLLVVLGLLGWVHRRSIVPRLTVPRPTASDDEVPAARRAPWLFWRLVAVELAVMGAVSGVAVALGSTAPPAPQLPTGELTPAEIVTGHPLPPAPTTELWITSFQWDLIPALGCLAAVVVYLRWVHRLRSRGDHWPLGRTLCLLAGVLTLFWTTSGGAAVYGHVLFSAHMIQHMTLVMIMPIFIVLSAPVTLAARALPVRTDGSLGPREALLGVVHSRWAQLLGHPLVAAANFVGSMFLFYYTDAFELALRTYAGHLAMIAHFSLAGYLFMNALIGVDPAPSRPSYPLRLLLLFAAMASHAFFGLALVSEETLLASEWFGLLGRPWGPSALEDQRIGGAIAWGISELPMLAVAITVAVAWTRDDERTARRRDRAADRDGDAELHEYNAMLARMGEDRRR